MKKLKARIVILLSVDAKQILGTYRDLIPKMPFGFSVTTINHGNLVSHAVTK